MKNTTPHIGTTEWILKRSEEKGIFTGYSDGELFFYQLCDKMPSLCGIKCDFVEKIVPNLNEEFVILGCEETVILMEINRTIHLANIVRLQGKIPQLRKLYPKYNDKKIVGCLAGMSVPQKCRIAAEDAGLIVITQHNDDITVLNTTEFQPTYL